MTSPLGVMEVGMTMGIAFFGGFSEVMVMAASDLQAQFVRHRVGHKL
jgi:hypothetical protein